MSGLNVDSFVLSEGTAWKLSVEVEEMCGRVWIMCGMGKVE